MQLSYEDIGGFTQRFFEAAGYDPLAAMLLEEEAKGFRETLRIQRVDVYSDFYETRYTFDWVAYRGSGFKKRAIRGTLEGEDLKFLVSALLAIARASRD